MAKTTASRTKVRRVADLLNALHEHVFATGHRQVLFVSYPARNETGVCCTECDSQTEREESPAYPLFEATIAEKDLVRDPMATMLTSREALMRWMSAIPSPIDQLRDPPKDGWDLLLKRSYE